LVSYFSWRCPRSLKIIRFRSESKDAHAEISVMLRLQPMHQPVEGSNRQTSMHGDCGISEAAMGTVCARVTRCYVEPIMNTLAWSKITLFSVAEKIGLF